MRNSSTVFHCKFRKFSRNGYSLRHLFSNYWRKFSVASSRCRFKVFSRSSSRCSFSRACLGFIHTFLQEFFFFWQYFKDSYKDSFSYFCSNKNALIGIRKTSKYFSMNRGFSSSSLYSFEDSFISFFYSICLVVPFFFISAGFHTKNSSGSTILIPSEIV